MDKLHQNLKRAKGTAAVPSVQLDDRRDSRALSLSHWRASAKLPQLRNSEQCTNLKYYVPSLHQASQQITTDLQWSYTQPHDPQGWHRHTNRPPTATKYWNFVTRNIKNSRRFNLMASQLPGQFGNPTCEQFHPYSRNTACLTRRAVQCP